MTGYAEMVRAFPPWAVVLAVFALPALEASTLLGVVVPGEIAVFLGGVLANQGKVSLVAVMGAAAAGAIAGDSVGYLLGARLGPALFTRASKRVAGPIEEARAFVRRFGGPAVLLGRWVAFLRVLVPSLAGASGLARRRFATYNVAGGTLWAVTVASVGFVTGTASHHVARSLGLAGPLGALALVLGAILLIHRLLRQGPNDLDSLHRRGRTDPDQAEASGERGLDGSEPAP
jgi:membrane-associated protein